MVFAHAAYEKRDYSLTGPERDRAIERFLGRPRHEIRFQPEGLHHADDGVGIGRAQDAAGDVVAEFLDRRGTVIGLHR